MKARSFYSKATGAIVIVENVHKEIIIISDKAAPTLGSYEAAIRWAALEVFINGDRYDSEMVSDS